VIKGQVRVTGALVLAAAFSLMGASPAVAQLKSVQGILSGVVRDAAGTPQMGASVEVIPELAAASAPLGFFTNTQGIFRGERLAPGFYTVRVTLAGFLPTLEKHIRVSANLTTLVRIQMESMFSSLEQLRRALCARRAGDADPRRADRPDQRPLQEIPPRFPCRHATCSPVFERTDCISRYRPRQRRPRPDRRTVA